MSPEPPPYPPRGVWSFPPPPVGKSWFWISIVSAVVGSLLGLSLIVTAAVLESNDAPGLIEDPVLLDTIYDACDVMTVVVEDLDFGSQPEDLATTIREQNTAVTEMVESIRQLPGEVISADSPTEAWLRDWIRLATAREAYARTLEEYGDRTGPFNVPVDADELPIYYRMEDALLEDVCRVPDALIDPGQQSTSTI